MWHVPATETFLPARGNAIVTVTVVDENGFTHHYEPIETRRDTVSRALALLTHTRDR
ncbi:MULTISPECIES: hypothetical protein [unclassified Microbacterium]|uniref:hypothetical protein n=1 Tax=unclassified Microbacterium TaxID=2609290 RepID=UPI0003B4A866|nr:MULTISPECIES: hypothetical protein [unclassified Microbacterium]